AWPSASSVWPPAPPSSSSARARSPPTTRLPARPARSSSGRAGSAFAAPSEHSSAPPLWAVLDARRLPHPLAQVDALDGGGGVGLARGLVGADGGELGAAQAEATGGDVAGDALELHGDHDARVELHAGAHPRDAGTLDAPPGGQAVAHDLGLD